MKTYEIKGDQAHEIAEVLGWPHKNPVVVFENVGNGELVGGYDAGLDYDKDGYTFEWEWFIGHEQPKMEEK